MFKTRLLSGIVLVIVLIGIVIDKGIFSSVENYLLKKRGLK